MRSFATLSLLVSLVFSGFSAAAPYPGKTEQSATLVNLGDVNVNVLKNGVRGVDQTAGVIEIEDVTANVLSIVHSREVTQNAGIAEIGNIEANVAGYQVTRDVSQDATAVEIEDVTANILSIVHSRDVEQDTTAIEIEDVTANVLSYVHSRGVEQDATGVNLDVEPVANVLSQYSTREAEHPSFPTIILDVSSRIAPLCKKLGTLATVDVTVAIVTPIVDEIKFILAGAAIEVEALRGQPIEYILYQGGAVLSIQAMGEIIAALIILIYTAIAGVLSVVAAAQVSLILPILVQLSVVLAHLLFAIFINVAGLQAVVLILIRDIVPAILDVDCTSLVAVLGINTPL